MMQERKSSLENIKNLTNTIELHNNPPKENKLLKFIQFGDEDGIINYLYENDDIDVNTVDSVSIFLIIIFPIIIFNEINN